MPVVLRVTGYRFWFYEADLDEPAHVHVGKEGREAKFRLEPIGLGRGGGFSPHEVRDIERILIDYRDELLAAWEREQDRRAHG